MNKGFEWREWSKRDRALEAARWVNLAAQSKEVREACLNMAYWVHPQAAETWVLWCKEVEGTL